MGLMYRNTKMNDQNMTHQQQIKRWCFPDNGEAPIQPRLWDIRDIPPNKKIFVTKDSTQKLTFHLEQAVRNAVKSPAKVVKNQKDVPEKLVVLAEDVLVNKYKIEFPFPKCLYTFSKNVHV